MKKKENLADLLNNWNTMNNKLSELTINEIQTLIDIELANKKRETIVTRLHMRLAKLKNTKDREALLKKCK